MGNTTFYKLKGEQQMERKGKQREWKNKEFLKMETALEMGKGTKR